MIKKTIFILHSERNLSVHIRKEFSADNNSENTACNVYLDLIYTNNKMCMYEIVQYSLILEILYTVSI